MPIEFKSRKNNLPHIQRALKLRVKDYENEELSRKEEDTRVSSLLVEQKFSFTPALEVNQPMSSHQMRDFLRDSRFFVNLTNTELSELERNIKDFARKGINNIEHLQKNADALDAETIEAEIKIARSVDKVHYNSFSRERDMPLSQTDPRWYEDLKTGLSFESNQLLKVYPSAGATLPVLTQTSIPVVDAVLVGEETDVGDSQKPIISTDPRYSFLPGKSFRHVIIRREFDTEVGNKINRTPSYVTLLFSLSNLQLINWMKLTPAAASSIIVDQVSYVNEINEEIVLNANHFDAGVSVILFFEPIKAKYLKVRLAQYAPVQKLARYTEDPSVAQINKLLEGLSWSTRLNDTQEYIEGRVFDFSIQNINVGLNLYEGAGLFRSKDIKVQNLAAAKARDALDIVPIISRANRSGMTQELSSADPTVEFYLGVEAKDRSGRLILKDLIPLVDTHPVQTEYLPLIGDMGILKFFPDLFWNITQHRVSSVVAMTAPLYEVVTLTPHDYQVGDVIAVNGSMVHNFVREYEVLEVTGDFSFVIRNDETDVEVGTNDTPYLYTYLKSDVGALTDNPPIRVYRNNNELTFGVDYKINFGNSLVFSGSYPVGQTWAAAQIDARSGNCRIQIIDPKYEDTYRVEYKPLKGQYLGKTKLVRLVNGRVVFNRRLRRSRAIVNMVAILRSGYDNPYLTPILRSYTLQLNTYE